MKYIDQIIEKYVFFVSRRIETIDQLVLNENKLNKRLVIMIVYVIESIININVKNFSNECMQQKVVQWKTKA